MEKQRESKFTKFSIDYLIFSVNNDYNRVVTANKCSNSQKWEIQGGDGITKKYPELFRN